MNLLGGGVGVPVPVPLKIAHVSFSYISTHHFLDCMNAYSALINKLTRNSIVEPKWVPSAGKVSV